MAIGICLVNMSTDGLRVKVVVDITHILAEVFAVASTSFTWKRIIRESR